MVHSESHRAILVYGMGIRSCPQNTDTDTECGYGVQSSPQNTDMDTGCGWQNTDTDTE